VSQAQREHEADLSAKCSRKECQRTTTARGNFSASSAPERRNYHAARGLGNFGSQNGYSEPWVGWGKQKRGAGSIGGCLVVSETRRSL